MQRQTSLEVYWTDVQPKLRDLQAEVLSTIKRLGPVTDLQLEAELSGRRASTVRGRRAELVAMGLVERCGRGGDGKRYLWKAK